jgi:hypothetical protein
LICGQFRLFLPRVTGDGRKVKRQRHGIPSLHIAAAW